MKTVFFLKIAILFLIPTLVFGQNKSNVAIIGQVGGEFLGEHQNGFTARVAFGGVIDPISVGVGGGVTIIGGTNIYPLFLHVSFAGKNKINPALVFEPGYGIYKKGNATGGLTFYGGAGVSARSRRTITMLTAGYSHYTIEIADILKTNMTGLGVRLTLVGL